jgi:hypothetical protein
MQRIAAPMVGGMITAPLLSMFVIPAAFLLIRRREMRRRLRLRAFRPLLADPAAQLDHGLAAREVRRQPVEGGRRLASRTCASRGLATAFARSAIARWMR